MKQPLVGLAVVLAAAVALVARQPVGASWARYADADAIYTGSGIAILDGERTKYFDHPGMPLQALAAVTFGVEFGIHELSGGRGGLHAYASDTMLHLDRTRVWFRGWAILIYLAGAAATFLLVARLLGSTLLGVAAGLAWVAAPGIGAMSIQLRPDVALTALCVGLAYLISTAATQRDAARLGLAAFVLGIALTVKVHAAGMFAPLALVTVFRAPVGAWWRPIIARARALVARRRLLIAASVAAWFGLIVLLNARAWPFGPAPSQRVLVAEIAGGLVLYWIAALAAARFGAPPVLRAVIGPFPAFVLTLVAAGVALSLSLVLSDAGIALQAMRDSLTGHGINSGVPLLHRLSAHLSLYAAPAVALTVLVCTIAYRRRCFWPVAVLAGAAALTAMAVGRGGPGRHYFAPGFMLGVVVALWLVRETRSPLLRIAAVALTAGAAAYAIVDRPVAHEASACAASVARARELLLPHEAVLASRKLWLPDIEYRTIVETYDALAPPFPYAFVASTPDAAAFAKSQGLRLRYAVDPSLATAHAGEVRTIGTAGRYVVRPVYRDAGCGVAAITPA
jgi:hypothetical protein